MNFYKLFYWLTVANRFQGAIGALAIVGLVLTIFFLIGLFTAGTDAFNINEYKDWLSPTKWIFRIGLCCFLFFGSAWIFTPSKSDCLLIIAGGAVGNFLTSDSSSKQLPSDITKFLHSELQAEIMSSSDDVKKQLGLQSPKEKLLDKAKNMTKDELINLIKSDTTAIIKE